jgi:hypothetical protein
MILLSGKAGSGKDTVGEMLEQEFGGAQRIALADPIKRFGYHVLDMPEDVLWGPSELRSTAFDRRTLADLNSSNRGEQASRRWANEVAEATGKSVQEVEESLETWFKIHVGHRFSQGDVTARSVLQTLGTEFGRYLDQDVWVKCAKKAADECLSGRIGYDKIHGSTTPKQTNVVIVTDGRFKNEILAVRGWGGVAIKVWNPSAKGLEGEAAKHASETEQDTIPNWWFSKTLLNNKAHGLDGLRRTVQHIASDVFPTERHATLPVL